MAMVHGVIIGVAAVALIGFILAGTNDKLLAAKSEDGIENEIPASGPPAVETTQPPISADTQSLQLYARQHGVFSDLSSAKVLVASDPLLMTAAVVNVGNQYYIWSAIGLSEAEIMNSEQEGTYRKAFVADTSSCQAVGAGKLVDVLTSTESAKIKISTSENDDKNVMEFNQNIANITAFTDDMRIIRLHLISHYSYTENCVKITF